MKRRWIALKLPPVTYEDETAGRHRIVVLDGNGNWVDEETGPAGFECEALARIAAKADRGVSLRCEAALTADGAPSGWKRAGRAWMDLGTMRACAAIAILDGSPFDRRLPLSAVERLLELAVELTASEPWKDPALTVRPEVMANVHAGDEDREIDFTLVITPPKVGCCDAFWLSFEQEGGDALTFSMSPGWQPEMLDGFLQRRGLMGVPTLHATTPERTIRALSLEEQITLLTLLDVVADAPGGSGVRGADGGLRDVFVTASMLVSRGRTAKVGRNDRCPCGSGRKYKKCCLAVDELNALSPRIRAHAMGKGFVDVVVSRDGKPVPAGGYDDCPICRAKTPEEALRLMREHNGETVH